MAIEASNAAKARGDALGKNEASMSLRTFQRVAGYAALATTGKGDVVCVIADFREYYDGLVISGYFIKKGTYSYVTTRGANKTVLVYVYKPHKTRLEAYADDFIRNQEPIVVDTPSNYTI